ncbi:hypothetical protein [Microbacterium sp. P02]|uniref:hypothetical protein n=1 Tax=Microbacterium sp. P02 TaxID=3366260 RepID=UPI0036717199
MASTPEQPLDGEDLKALREEIDELQAVPQEELLSPVPTDVEQGELVPHPTDAIGSEKWDEPAEEEHLDQE